MRTGRFPKQRVNRLGCALINLNSPEELAIRRAFKPGSEEKGTMTSRGPEVDIQKWVMIAFLMGLIHLAGCSRADLPAPTAIPTNTPEPSATPSPIRETPTPTRVVQPSNFAVVWISRDENLSVRLPAGISGEVVTQIPWDARDVELTGAETFLGSSRWVEVRLEEGVVKGWVNAWYLTEAVQPVDFCRDGTINELVQKFKTALANQDGEGLAELISPKRGLIIRLNWYSPEVIFTPAQVVNLFSSTEVIDWGIMAESDLQVSGTFSEVIWPKLEDVFTRQHEPHCNDLYFGASAREVIWPVELTNVNMINFYRAASEESNELDWRTWALGIEYVNGKPTLSILIHYMSEL
jgi:hypothetical protein